MMEGILNKEQLAKVHSKALEAKLKIVGGDFIFIIDELQLEEVTSNLKTFKIK